MHAWIGFFFSCVMIILAAAGKSGYNWMPAGIGGTPNTELMFYIGCVGFAGALAMLAPSHSSARLASIWSTSALAAVVIALNLNALTGNLGKDHAVETATPIQLQEPEITKEEIPVNFILKRTVTNKDFKPFEDFEYRVRMLEREAPPQPEGSEAFRSNLPN